MLVLDSDKECDTDFILEAEEFLAGRRPMDVEFDLENNPTENETLSGKPKRVIVFTTKDQLTMLETERKACGDGTFRVGPAFFKQVFILLVKMGKKKKNWVPAFYALLPDKSQISYYAIWFMVKKRCQELGITPKLELIRMDYELSAMKAAAAAFKWKVKGCLYHFSQGV